tara:strand:+ start:4240 stop:4854 length:615 start_codon:yes stop_codon:yes gene_type:complete
MLDISYFDRDLHTVAKALLGCLLVRQTQEGLCTCTIVEVEAYGGGEDDSSHANSNKPTRKTTSMFMEPGTVYVYSIHKYHCLNVVVRAAQKPSAILIRAAEPLEGVELMAMRRNIDLNTPRAHLKLLSGPGKLCQALAIDRGEDGLMYDGDELYFEQGVHIPENEILSSPRIGLNPKTCPASVEWPWRYTIRGSRYVSKKVPSA